MSNNKVVVHCATGHLGWNVVDSLLDHNLSHGNIITPVRKLQAEEAKDLSRHGTKMFEADYMDRASLVTAYKGAHTVVFIPPPTSVLERVTAVENSIAAALACKVTRFIAVSIGAGKVDSPSILAPAFLHLESAARVSGMKWLIIRMGFFATNIEQALNAALQTGEFQQPAPRDLRMPYITRHDIGKGIAAAVMKWELEGQVLEFTGSTAISFEEIAEKLSHFSGKPIVYKEIAEKDFSAMMKPKMGDFADFVARLMATFYEACDRGEFHITRDLKELTGHKPKPMEDYLKHLVKVAGKREAH